MSQGSEIAAQGSPENEQFGPAYPPVTIDYSGEESPYGAPLRQTLKHIITKVPPGSTLLDIGGSDGRYSIPLAKAGLNVVVFDLISESLEAVERHAAEEGVSDRITVQQGDVYKHKPFDFREKDFDATLNAAFISLHNPEQAKDMNRKAVNASKIGALSVVELYADHYRTDSEGDEVRGKEEYKYSTRGIRELAADMFGEDFVAADYAETHLIMQDGSHNVDAKVGTFSAVHVPGFRLPRTFFDPFFNTSGSS